MFRPFRGFVDRLQNLLGWPVIILGVICLGFWLLGSWFRKIANQSADYCERVVEAQFAAQTKNLKSRRRDQDAQFLAERVIDPELLLRSSDDLMPEIYRRDDQSGLSPSGTLLLENRELAFLRNIRLLYQDYLDGSPFHRSDTKASVQLLGNLALTNLRRSHLGHLLREGRVLDRLDLNRAGRLLGGPYLWFNYITRMLVQETAILLLDYNRHAIPLDRLACSAPESRQAFANWLAGRLKIEPDEVRLPEPVSTAGTRAAAVTKADVEPRRPEASDFLETVEFTAIDFLADDPERDAAIQARFGPQVAELVRRDRQQNVRRAFRSFPLHELPLAQRTINPFAFYETYLSGGRIVFLPVLMIGAAAGVVGMAIRTVYRVVREILHPRVDQDEDVPSDTYWAALRKIHRMRKPVFMGSLWLRARFDAEYLGLPLPSAPPGIAAHSLMESDLDFIGASRQDRIIAEQVRSGHQRRLEWIGRWLQQFGWTFDQLPEYLAREIPYLANRGGEALRAVVAACVLDHDDITTLAFSIEGLKRVLAHGADATLDGTMLPPGLPDPVINLRKLWHPVPRVRRPVADLFGMPCFPPYDQAQRSRILAYLRRHRRAVRGWINVLLGQGGDDPWATVRARMREVLLRTDLWSDQILVLRAVQTLTMLDVQHNCDLVWSLGGYTHLASDPACGDGPPPAPFASALPRARRVRGDPTDREMTSRKPADLPSGPMRNRRRESSPAPGRVTVRPVESGEVAGRESSLLLTGRGPGRRAGFEDVPVCAAACGQADGQGILLGGGRGPADDLAVRTKGKQFQTIGPGAQGDCAGHGLGQEREMFGCAVGQELAHVSCRAWADLSDGRDQDESGRRKRLVVDARKRDHGLPRLELEARVLEGQGLAADPATDGLGPGRVDGLDAFGPVPREFAGIGPHHGRSGGNVVVIRVGHDGDVAGGFAWLQPGKLLDRGHPDGQPALLDQGSDGGRVMLGREHRLEELRGGELEAVGRAGRADVPAAEGDGGRGHDSRESQDRKMLTTY